MRSPGINGEGELRGQPANPGSPGKMANKTECVCVYIAMDAFVLCECSLFPHAVVKLLSCSLLSVECGKSTDESI